MLGLIWGPQHLGLRDVAGSKTLNPGAKLVHPACLNMPRDVVLFAADSLATEACEVMLGHLFGIRLGMMALGGKYGGGRRSLARSLLEGTLLRGGLLGLAGSRNDLKERRNLWQRCLGACMAMV